MQIKTPVRCHFTPVRMAAIQKSISNVKRQPSECEKIIANEATDKQLKNIQATYAAQFQKNKQPNQKVGQRTK